MKICVFGAASDEIDKVYIEEVEKLGELMAKRGHSLVFGAGGHGLMGAAARGVYKGGAEICGVIPKFFEEEKVELIFDKCNELIFTDTMSQRKAKMEDLADAFIIVPGGIGTFEEFFEVLTLKQLGRHVKPIVIYNINGYYSNMIKFMDTACKERFIRNDLRLIYGCCNTADEVLDYIESDKQIKRSIQELKNG